MIASTCVESLLLLAKLSLATRIILNTHIMTNKIITTCIRTDTPCPCKSHEIGDELLITTQFVSGILFWYRKK
jgi:hypothetical protein